MCYGSKPLCYTLHLFCTLAFFELTLYLIFTVSPVQVRSNAIVHLLFFSQIEFFKNAQKPHKNAVKTDCIYFDRFFWRRHPDLNWGIKLLQSSALPLGYGAELLNLKTKDAIRVLCLLWSGRRDSNSRRSPWQGDALPLSHSRIA